MKTKTCIITTLFLIPCYRWRSQPPATATAKAIALVTPTHTQPATPFHVVMEEAPFWNSALGIFFVFVIATVVDIVTKAAMGTIR